MGEFLCPCAPLIVPLVPCFLPNPLRHGDRAMFVAYYNFVWRTRHADKSGKLRPTAAMMAKVTDHLWTFDELYDTVGNYG